VAKKIRGMSIREVSLVDKGANPGARIALYKRAEADQPATAQVVVLTKQSLRAKMAEVQKDYPAAQQPEMATMFSELYDEDFEEFYEAWYDMLCALGDSVRSITGDQELTVDQRKQLLEQTLTEFHDTAVAELAVAKSKTQTRTTDGDETMTAEVEKLNQEIAELTSKLEAADAKLNKKGEKEGDACMLDGEEGSMAMEAGKLVCVTKRELEKRNAVPEHIKKKLDEQELEISKLRDKDELNEFTKRAEAYGKLPIEGAKFAPILRKLSKALAAEEFAEVERVLKAAHEAMGHVLKVHGTDGTVPGSALEAINAKANEISKKQGISKEKAFDQACQENPDLYDRYQTERKAR
jgi:hypothetical protein